MSDKQSTFTPKTPKGNFLVLAYSDANDLLDKIKGFTPEVLEQIFAFEHLVSTGSQTAAAVATVQQQIPATVQSVQDYSNPNPTYSAPVQATSYPAAPAATGGTRVVVDRWSNPFTYNMPGAPMTPRGPALLKEGRGQKPPHRPYKQWVDPAKGPEFTGDRNPADLFTAQFVD